MTLEEDYKLAKRIDELLCTEYYKNDVYVRIVALEQNKHLLVAPTGNIDEYEEKINGIIEHYCATMAEKKALREFGRFDELKRIYGEDE